MRKATSARPAWHQTGATQLRASLRGIVYGFAGIVIAPVAWTAGQTVAAVFIGVVAVIGIGLEMMATRPRDQAPILASRVIRS